jgi:hypothetical protein
VLEFRPLEEPEVIEREAEVMQQEKDFSVPFAANF